MKIPHCLLGAGLASLLLGCSSTPVALAPVGPDPSGGGAMASGGELRVFSSLAGRSEGDNPAWYQHTGYYIYGLTGRLVRHVYNTVGRYAPEPRPVVLPPGNYMVKARARDYVWVDVPVTIKCGRTTTLHLDGDWTLPADVSPRKIVSLPNGNPVGWRTSPAKPVGIN